jgi:hypothetical protein
MDPVGRLKTFFFDFSGEKLVLKTATYLFGFALIAQYIFCRVGVYCLGYRSIGTLIQAYVVVVFGYSGYRYLKEQSS